MNAVETWRKSKVLRWKQISEHSRRANFSLVNSYWQWVVQVYEPKSFLMGINNWSKQIFEKHSLDSNYTEIEFVWYWKMHTMYWWVWKGVNFVLFFIILLFISTSNIQNHIQVNLESWDSTRQYLVSKYPKNFRSKWNYIQPDSKMFWAYHSAINFQQQ